MSDSLVAWYTLFSARDVILGVSDELDRVTSLNNELSTVMRSAVYATKTRRAWGLHTFHQRQNDRPIEKAYSSSFKTAFESHSLKEGIKRMATMGGADVVSL